MTRNAGGQSLQRIFHYEDSLNPRKLTGITDERGVRYATWAYDLQGRALSSEHAGGAEKVHITYNANGTSTVTNALGKKATYSFAVSQGVKHISAINGIISANCAASNSTFTYDTKGLLRTKKDSKTHPAAQSSGP